LKTLDHASKEAQKLKIQVALSKNLRADRELLIEKSLPERSVAIIELVMPS